MQIINYEQFIPLVNSQGQEFILCEPKNVLYKEKKCFFVQNLCLFILFILIYYVCLYASDGVPLLILFLYVILVNKSKCEKSRF